jgi:Stress responsive A/B Barrel Domain
MPQTCSCLQRYMFGAVLLCAVSTISVYMGPVFVGRNISVAQDTQAKPLRHVVLFKFKDSASKEQVEKLVNEFRGLSKKIPTIAEFEYGVNNSPEGLNEGLTHCFLVTFKTEKDRDAYLPHAAHKDFVEQLLPHLDKAVVVDYFAGK